VRPRAHRQKPPVAASPPHHAAAQGATSRAIPARLDGRASRPRRRRRGGRQARGEAAPVHIPASAADRRRPHAPSEHVRARKNPAPHTPPSGRRHTSDPRRPALRTWPPGPAREQVRAHLARPNVVPRGDARAPHVRSARLGIDAGGPRRAPHAGGASSSPTGYGASRPESAHSRATARILATGRWPRPEDAGSFARARGHVSTSSGGRASGRPHAERRATTTLGHRETGLSRAVAEVRDGPHRRAPAHAATGAALAPGIARAAIGHAPDDDPEAVCRDGPTGGRRGVRAPSPRASRSGTDG
jgi:hypothetical protein